MASVSLALRDAAGQSRGLLVVSELPGGARLAIGESTSLLEGQKYRYQVTGVSGVLSIEPAELFEPDDESLRAGRILPGQSVGTLLFVVECDGIGATRATIDVAPTKLTQVGEYRRMLGDITRHSAEAVLQGFAPATLGAAVSTRSTEFLYQRFAMLESQLSSEDFAAAMGRILSDPHVEWRTVPDSRPPGSPYPAGSAFGKALAARGPRQPWLPSRGRPVLSTMPTMLQQDRHETTLDTVPNRLVKYILETWRAIAQELRDRLEHDDATAMPGPVRRGLRAAAGILGTLDELLSSPLFREVRSLDRFPTSNQVMLKRAGYRQILHMFVLVGAGLELPWEAGVEDAYSPSLRNVATLYEYWSYLTLVDIVGRLCGRQQTAHAFTTGANGLSLHLKTGAASALHWRTTRRGRPLEVRLMFNRSFVAERDSWTATMRPDCSVLIRPLALTPDPDSEALDVWLHFDAKYRVTGTQPVALTQEADESDLFRGSAKRDDLLKMHAYRDAIRRTAGAYILYPGDDVVDQRQFSELLPGLGAFPLRPGEAEALGVEAISRFLTDALDHVAEQASQHERDRFWRARIYASPAQERPHLSPVPFLDRPPADTDVLLGFVRGAQHQAWTERTRSYNVRADHRTGSLRLGSRALSAGLLLLYGPGRDRLRVIGLFRSGEWRAVDRQELVDSGYPNPGGRLYLVTSLTAVLEPPDWLADIAVDDLSPPDAVYGSPFAVTWLDLLSSVRRP